MPDISFHGHSAVSVGPHGQQLFVDPGAFSDLSPLAGAAAILVTHAHPDHLAVAAVLEADDAAVACTGDACLPGVA